MGRVTLQSIADRVGVSRMTVSNAFSRPDQLSAELRQTILRAADELGYVGPDPAARALARGSTGAVGLLLTDSLGEAFRDAVATAFLAAVADALAARGLALTLLTPGGHAGDVVPARDVAMDGVLVYVCEPDSPDVAWLTKRGLPMVGVDQHPTPGVPQVNVDDEAGARAAARHLVELGHRRVGVLTISTSGRRGVVPDPLSEPNSFASRQRLVGWLSELEAAGVEPLVMLTPLRSEYNEHAVQARAVELLDRPDRPTAVLCFSDMFASAAIRAAQSLGLTVPGDLSVVGFDDSPLATYVEPPLTTVRQDVSAKGQAAVAKLAEVLEARKAGAAEPDDRVMLSTELVVRASTGPPPDLS